GHGCDARVQLEQWISAELPASANHFSYRAEWTGRPGKPSIAWRCVALFTAVEHDSGAADRLVVRFAWLLCRCKGDSSDRRRRDQLEPGGPEVSGSGEPAEREHQLRTGAVGRIPRALRRVQRSVGHAGYSGAGAAAVPTIYGRQPVYSELW